MVDPFYLWMKILESQTVQLITSAISIIKTLKVSAFVDAQSTNRRFTHSVVDQKGDDQDYLRFEAEAVGLQDI